MRKQPVKKTKQKFLSRKNYHSSFSDMNLSRGSDHASSSLSHHWRELTIQQKVLRILVGLIVMGVSTVLAYRLIMLIFEMVRLNPTKPAEFLASTKFNAIQDELFLENPYSESLSLIENARIEIKPVWRLEMASIPSGDKWLKLIEEEIYIIKNLLNQTIHPELLLKILKDPTFSIQLVAYNDGELNGAAARYLPISNKLLIGSDTDMSDKEKLVTLCNDMHHVAVRYTNFAKQTSPEKNLPTLKEAIKVIRPVIEDNWKSSPQLIKKHRAALTAGFVRIENFKKLLTQSQQIKHKTFIAENSREDLNKLLSAISNYTPIIYAEEIPVSSYPRFEKEFKKEHGKIVIPFSTPGYFISKKMSPGGIVLRYNFLKSEKITDKAKAFIYDVENYKKALGSDGGYRHYTAPEDLDLELSSFLQEIKPDILKVFSPEWCDYFSRYHKVEDYCESFTAKTKG